MNTPNQTEAAQTSAFSRDTDPTAVVDTASKPQVSGKLQLRLARKAFDALAFLDHKDWSNHREKLLAMCKAEEKDHRGFLPDFNRHHTEDTASITDAAKLFAVKRIAQYLNGDSLPVGKDYLHTQKSCFYAAGLVDEYGPEIRSAWNEAGFVGLHNLNYTDVVKVREVMEEALV